MGFKKLDNAQWEKAARRWLIIGPPNSRKTSSLLSAPQPNHILVYPGEKGSSSIRLTDGVFAYVWETEGGEVISPGKTWREVEGETKKILAGTYGPVQTFCGDGLHKLYGIIYDACLSELVDAMPNTEQEKLGGMAYGRAHKRFLNYLTMVNQSNVPNVVFTCWSAKEKDNPDNRNSQSHIWPDLPGMAAQWVLGEFSVVVYAEVGLPNPQGEAPAFWQLRPAGAVWGVGVKGPVEIVSKLPAKVPQDWRKLETALLGKPN